MPTQRPNTIDGPPASLIESVMDAHGLRGDALTLHEALTHPAFAGHDNQQLFVRTGDDGEYEYAPVSRLYLGPDGLPVTEPSSPATLSHVVGEIDEAIEGYPAEAGGTRLFLSNSNSTLFAVYYDEVTQIGYSSAYGRGGYDMTRYYRHVAAEEDFDRWLIIGWGYLGRPLIQRQASFLDEVARPHFEQVIRWIDSALRHSLGWDQEGRDQRITEFREAFIATNATYVDLYDLIPTYFTIDDYYDFPQLNL